MVGSPDASHSPDQPSLGDSESGTRGKNGARTLHSTYTRGDVDGRAPFQIPEIQRADLCQSVLELKSLGITRPSELSWLERPPSQALENSETLLFRLGAAQAGGGPLTELGRKLAKIPAHPRIARMLLEYPSNDTATLGALISEGELESSRSGDALDCLNNRSLSGAAKKLAEQMLRSIEGVTAKSRTKDPLAFAVLAGFPDRVARKRGQDLVFSEGGSARAPESDFFHSGEYFVLLDVQERQGLGQSRSTTDVKSGVAIQADWLLDLEPVQFRETEELSWDSDRKRVQSLSQIKYGQLVLSESRAEPSDSLAASRVLAKSGLGLDLESWGSKLTLHDAFGALGRIASPDHPEQIEAWVRRVDLLRGLRPELPVIDVLFLKNSVERILSPYVALSELRELDWIAALNGSLEELLPGLSQELERETPLCFELPNGRKPNIHYKMNSAPWIESRLQDFFGVRAPPSILRGRLPLTLHLLAPNQRAVQVTTDLPGFWKKTYPEIRTELSALPPSHLAGGSVQSGSFRLENRAKAEMKSQSWQESLRTLRGTNSKILREGIRELTKLPEKPHRLALSEQPFDSLLLRESAVFKRSRELYLKQGGRYLATLVSSPRTLTSPVLLEQRIEYTPITSELNWAATDRIEKESRLTELRTYCTNLFHEQNHRILWKFLPPPHRSPGNVARYLNLVESLIVAIDMALGDELGHGVSRFFYLTGVTYDPGTDILGDGLSMREYRNYLHACSYATFMKLEFYDAADIKKAISRLYPQDPILLNRALKRLSGSTTPSFKSPIRCGRNPIFLKSSDGSARALRVL